MATGITKEKLLNDLEKLKNTLEFPKLFLANYFKELRSDVDKEFAPKQLELQKEKKNLNQLDELWQQMIAKIDSFEKNCTRGSYDLVTTKKRINRIEAMLNTIDLKEAEAIIEEEEKSLLENIF